MDVGRGVYRTDHVRPFRDSDLEIPIQWYVCPPGALDFPYPHIFGLPDYDETPWETPRPGVQWDEPRVGLKPWTPPTVDGQRFCGPREWFEQGVPRDDTRPPTGRDLWGVSLCCAVPPPGPPWLVRGGIEVGGSDGVPGASVGGVEVGGSDRGLSAGDGGVEVGGTESGLPPGAGGVEVGGSDSGLSPGDGGVEIGGGDTGLPAGDGGVEAGGD